MTNATARVERIKPQVWTPKAELFVPHKDNEIVFAFPEFGPSDYKTVGKQILEKVPGKNLAVPTGDRTASLLYSAYCDSHVSGDSEFQNVKEIMRENWLWVFNKNIFTDKGVYILQDLEANGISNTDINELESMLSIQEQGIHFSEDRKVRFAPKETYKFGAHTPNSLVKDGFVMASYDFEGADKLGKVASKFRNNPVTYGVEISNGNNPEQRVSALDELDGRLRVVGYFDVSGRSHAFGVLE